MSSSKGNKRHHGSFTLELSGISLQKCNYNMAACAYLTCNYFFLVLLHDTSMSAAVVFIIFVTRCGVAPPGNCICCCRFCCTVFWWELKSLESFWRKRLGVGLLRADSNVVYCSVEKCIRDLACLTLPPFSACQDVGEHIVGNQSN